MALPYVITYPARFDVPEDQWQPVELLLSNLESSLADMAIALECYRQARQRLANDGDRDFAKSIEEARAQGQRQRDFENEVAARQGIPGREDMHGLERDERRKANLALDIAVAQEREALGHVPRDFIRRAPHAHALLFLAAADRFRKCLIALSVLRTEIIPLCEALAADFPGLKGVRDSAQHIDDRVRWLGRHGKPLDISVLSLENLKGDELESVDERGKLASFTVSSDVIRRFGEILQAAIDAMPSRGPRMVRPSFGLFPAP